MKAAAGRATTSRCRSRSSSSSSSTRASSSSNVAEFREEERPMEANMDDVIAKNWRELIRPRELETDDVRRASATASSPASRSSAASALTLGNALRRVLLSSLQGAAITSVRDRAACCTSSRRSRACMEDVTDIVLNLKEVRLRLHGEGPKILRVHQKGAGRAHARATSSERPDGRGPEPRHEDRHALRRRRRRARDHGRHGQGLRGAPRRTSARTCRSARSRSTRSSRR